MYSNSELLSESTSLWMIRAYRKRVAFPHLAQLTYVSETAARRVPRTSSCMTDTCLSFLFQGRDAIDCTRLRLLPDEGMTGKPTPGRVNPCRVEQARAPTDHTNS